MRQIAVALTFMLAQLIAIPKLPVPIPGIPQTIPIPPIPKELPPVARTTADALTQVPQLDDFNPRETRSLSGLPRTPDGGFSVSPGAYAWAVESYCLNVGAHAPGNDAAYLLAPLRGSPAAVVSNIVQRVAVHAEISQQTVQLLRWTITSRARIADTNGTVRAAAGVLMTAVERSDVDGDAFEALSPAVRDALLANAPPAAREAFDTVQQVPDLLTNGNASYAAIERIAAPLAQAKNGSVPRAR